MKIEKELVETAKQQAHDEGISLSKWMAQLMREKLNEPKEVSSETFEQDDTHHGSRF